MTQTAQTPTMIPYAVWKHEHDLRIQAEKKRDELQEEIFLLGHHIFSGESYVKR